MKKVFALLFVGSMLTFAACQNKPKTEETSTTDSTAVITTDTTTMATDSSTTMTTSTDTTAVADSAKK